MTRSVAYELQTTESKNPLARFAHRARIAKATDMVSGHLPHGGIVCDFGAGTGELLSRLADRRPDAYCYAVEPYMEASNDKRLAYVKGFADLPAGVDVVSAFEVCEHLTDVGVGEFVVGARAALRPGGRLVLSVPIMVGGALPFKELNRMLLFRRRSEYSVGEMVKGTLGLAVGRPEERRFTHKGFDFRWLRAKVLDGFEIESEIFTPLPLPWWANSQVFMVCRPRRVDLDVEPPQAA